MEWNFVMPTLNVFATFFSFLSTIDFNIVYDDTMGNRMVKYKQNSKFSGDHFILNFIIHNLFLSHKNERNFKIHKI